MTLFEFLKPCLCTIIAQSCTWPPTPNNGQSNKQGPSELLRKTSPCRQTSACKSGPFLVGNRSTWGHTLALVDIWLWPEQNPSGMLRCLIPVVYSLKDSTGHRTKMTYLWWPWHSRFKRTHHAWQISGWAPTPSDGHILIGREWISIHDAMHWALLWRKFHDTKCFTNACMHASLLGPFFLIQFQSLKARGWGEGAGWVK